MFDFDAERMWSMFSTAWHIGVTVAVLILFVSAWRLEKAMSTVFYHMNRLFVRTGIPRCDCDNCESKSRKAAQETPRQD